MDTPSLEATERPTIKPNSLRLSGKIPAVYYGRGKTPATLTVEYGAFRKVFEKAGENTIIELSWQGKKVPVLVHDIQYHPVTDVVSHIDFIHVDMDKEVTTSVKVSFIGVAPAIKSLGGVLDIHKHELKIRCLPKDLIHSIEVDVSSIVDFHTSIHVKDVKIPSTIQVLDNPEDTVVTASAQKIEEEKPAETAVSVEGAAAAPATEGGPPAADEGPAKEGKK